MKKDPENMTESERQRYYYLRERYLNKNFGITLSQYDVQILRQEGKCLVCLSTSPLPLVVDVSKDGKKRGLLCNRCRLGISYFNDDVLILQKAIEHINHFT